MAYPAASGFNQNAGTLVPQTWAARLLANYYASTCLHSICNTNQANLIKDQGDTVIIRTTPTIAIKSGYKKGQKLEYDQPLTDRIELLIDKGDVYGFVIDDIDEKQSDVMFTDQWLIDATEQFKISVDRQAFSLVYPDAHAKNKGANSGKITGMYNMGAAGAPLAIDKNNAIDVIVNVNSVLTEQNVPKPGRWIVIPDWMRNKLMTSEIRQVQITGDSVSPIRNGLIGRIDDTDIYVSNLLPYATDSGHYCNHILAGHRDAITFASQFVKNESFRAQDTFGTRYRGLQVWGIKVVKPEALVDVFAYAA